MHISKAWQACCGLGYMLSHIPVQSACVWRTVFPATYVCSRPPSRLAAGDAIKGVVTGIKSIVGMGSPSPVATPAAAGDDDDDTSKPSLTQNFLSRAFSRSRARKSGMEDTARYSGPQRKFPSAAQLKRPDLALRGGSDRNVRFTPDAARLGHDIHGSGENMEFLQAESECTLDPFMSPAPLPHVPTAASGAGTGPGGGGRVVRATPLGGRPTLPLPPPPFPQLPPPPAAAALSAPGSKAPSAPSSRNGLAAVAGNVGASAGVSGADGAGSTLSRLSGLARLNAAEPGRTPSNTSSSFVLPPIQGQTGSSQLPGRCQECDSPNTCNCSCSALTCWSCRAACTAPSHC